MVKIFVTSKISDSALNILKSVGEVEVWEKEETLNGQALLDKIQDHDAVLTMVNNFITDDILQNAPKLKVIGNCGVGYNNIDIASAEKHGVIVTNTPDVLNNATADLTWALILGIARRIVEADKFVREGKFTGWLPHLFIGNLVYGKSSASSDSGESAPLFAKGQKDSIWMFTIIIATAFRLKRNKR